MSRGQMCKHQMSAENFLSQKNRTKLNIFLLQICISHQISQLGWGGGWSLKTKNFLSPKPGRSLKTKNFLRDLDLPANLPTRGGGVAPGHTSQTDTY